MEHPILTAIAIYIFFHFITIITNSMINDKNAIIRFIGYITLLISAIATLKFIFTNYLGFSFNFL